MRLLIAHSKTLYDYATVTRALEDAHFPPASGIVSTGCPLAARFAWTQKIPLRVFKPEWDRHGKSAGLISKFEAASQSDYGLVIHDGTEHALVYQIKILQNCGCSVWVVKLEPTHTLVHQGQLTSRETVPSPMPPTSASLSPAPSHPPQPPVTSPRTAG